jgi:hypothetical protein
MNTIRQPRKVPYQRDAIEWTCMKIHGYRSTLLWRKLLIAANKTVFDAPEV